MSRDPTCVMKTSKVKRTHGRPREKKRVGRGKIARNSGLHGGPLPPRTTTTADRPTPGGSHPGPPLPSSFPPLSLPNNETSEDSGQDVTLIAKGNIGRRQPPLQGSSWSAVPCSRDLQGKMHSSLSKKTAWFTGHVGTRDSQEHHPGENACHTQNSSSTMTKILTQYQILGRLTSQKKKERYEVCWQEKSEMTSQQLYQKIQTNF